VAVRRGWRELLLADRVEPEELLAGVLDVDRPESVLTAARQAVATGLGSWGAASDEGIAALGLTRRQGLRLRLCARLLDHAERDAWVMPAPITSPIDVLPHLGDIRDARQERVVAIYLDARNRPIGREVVAIGGLRASVIQPRDILAPALALPAASLVLAHNHPSGDTRPSPEDVDVTRQLASAARIMGLELLDHVVVSRSGFTSLKELGLL
jgi:DNA repair protein RadC